MEATVLFWLMLKITVLLRCGFIKSEHICQEPLYQYQQECYVNCPLETTPNHQNRTCIDSCTDPWCMLIQPSPSSESNIYCPPKMCKPPRDKCFELKCLESCPPGTYLHRESCLRNCPADASLKINGACVSVCPDHAPYVDNSNCVSVCSEHHFRFRNICVENCPRGCHVFNKTCEKNCPTDFHFTVEIKNNSFCFDKCPDDTIVNNTTCKLDCPIENPLYFNQTCLSRCPEHSKYMVIARTSHKAILKCVSRCPKKLFYEGNSCVDRCSQGKAMLNNSCLDVCPESHHYRYQPHGSFHNTKVICTEKCPENVRVLDHHCYDICPENTFSYNKSCLINCPDPVPFHQKQYVEKFWADEISCVSQCSRPYKYVKGKKCITQCLPPLLLLNNTCVEKCSENFPFYQKRELDSTGGLECIESCSKSTVVYGNLCLEECPRNSSYIFNRTCVEKCPNTHPLIDIENRNRCLSDCNTLQYESMCLTKCPEGMLKYNNSCTNKCPDDQPLSDLQKRECVNNCSNIEYDNKCLNTCPNNTYQYLKQCLPQCPTGFYANKIDRTCVENCPKFYNASLCLDKCPNVYTPDKKCVIRCPNETRYTISSVKVSYTSYNYYPYRKLWKWKSVLPKCVEYCPSEYFVFENKCLPVCPSGYDFSFRQHCRKQCPTSYLYVGVKIDSVSPIKTIYKCLPECPRNMVYENKMCKNQCSSSSRFVVYNKCHKQCPQERALHFKYRDDKTNSIKFTCLSHCPEHSYKINSSCVLFCPSEMFGFNGNCVKYCPSSHSLNYSKIAGDGFAYFCERTCPVNTFLMGKNCYDVCPNLTFQYNTTCVDQCPNSHKFHRNATIHNNHKSVICEEKCPKFSDFKQCVSKCPLTRTFIHNNQCTSRCPTSRPLAPRSGDRFCYDTCPNGTFSFKEKHCIDICPYIYSIFNKRCQKKCPSSYIYFENTSKGKLCRDKCYNGLVLNINECISRCPVTTYNLQGVCQNIKRCPEQYPFEENRQQGRTCTDKCLQTNVLDGRFCESGCPFGYVIVDRKCVKNCPANAPNELHNKTALNFKYQVHCYGTCPDGYVSENRACITEDHCYNAGKISHGNKCIEECLSKLYVTENTNNHRRFCSVSCPTGYVFNDEKCILEQNCYNLKKYILNGKCIKDCKFRYYAENDYSKERVLCGEKCPKKQVLDETNLCIEEFDCDNAGKYLYMGTCIAKCPPGHLVTEVSYLYKGCSSSCPGNYHNGTHCQRCEEPLILYDGSCWKNCPAFRLIAKNILSGRECIWAFGTLSLFLLSLGCLILCVIVFRNVLIYNYADKKEIRLKKHQNAGVYTCDMPYDEEETCALKLDYEDNETSPLVGTRTQDRDIRQPIDCVSDTETDVNSAICSQTSMRTQGNGREIQEPSENKLTDEYNRYLVRKKEKEDFNTSDDLDSLLHEKTQIEHLEGTRDMLLESIFYQIHDIPKEINNDDNSFDSIDSITKLKHTFQESEAATSFEHLKDRNEKLEKSNTNNEQAIRNGIFEMQGATKSKNETICLDLFLEDVNDKSFNLNTKETEN